MKKLLRYFFLIVAVAIVSAVAFALVKFPPILSAMAAKTMCSCVNVMGRSPQSVVEKELTVFPGLASSHFEIVDSTSVTASFLWSTRKAIFRKGLGCTLLSERTEEEVRGQAINVPVMPEVKDSLTGPGILGWPGGGWAIFPPGPATNSAVTALLDSAFKETDPERPKNTLALLVVYNGLIIGEKYAEGFDQNSMFMGWSMTKSITNALVGILVKEGKLKVNDPAPVTEWQNDERKNITLNNLLQASSGLEWNESYFFPGDFHNMFTFSDDKGGYAASKKLKRPPGEFFEYSSGTTNLLSKMVRQAVGDSAYHRFPYERLFHKLGMYHTLIEPDASGTYVGSSYCYASARDWGRFGLLYLNDGLAFGERILPEGWVKYSSSPAPAAPIGQYGAQWWLNAGAAGNPEKSYHPGLPNDEFGAEGFEDQFVYVIPSRKLVIVRLGISHHGSDFDKLVQQIILALPAR